VHHAVGALLVIAGAVSVPIGLFHQFPEGLCVALAEQVAGALPAEYGAGRVAPRRAVIFLIAGEEIEEQARLTELPRTPAIAATENVAEQSLGRFAGEKVGLIRRAFVGVTGRHRDGIVADFAYMMEESGG